MRRLPTLTDVAQPSTSASVGLPGTASLLKLNESNLVPWLKVVRHLDPLCFMRQCGFLAKKLSV
jgi:hypothetical protein